MLLFVLKRAWQALLILCIMSILVFCSIYAIGNPIEIFINPQADAEEIARSTAALGLDKPLWQQYLHFVQQIFKGNLGNSFVYASPALTLIAEKLPATLELATTALIFALILGIPLGLWSGLRPNHWLSKTIMAGSILGFSLPTFWVGLMLIMLFSITLGWLPSDSRGETLSIAGVELSILTLDGWKHLLLPAINLALFKVALIIRLVRGSTRETLAQDYIKFARAKGLSNQRIIGVHVLKNIMIPLITILGIEFGGLIAFSVVTETIFNWPGIGKLLIDSIATLDRPVVVAYLLFVVLLYVSLNFMVDILYSILDPRVKLNGEKA